MPAATASAVLPLAWTNCFSQQQNIVHIATNREVEIADALTELSTQDIDVLAINGGDGTVAHVLTALLNGSDFTTLPILALMPGGTSNIAVGDVGLRGSLRRTAADLCSYAAGRLRVEIVTRPALSIDWPERAEPLHGLVFGAGVIVEGIDFWHEKVKARGMRGPGSSFIAMLGTVYGVLRGDARFLRPVPIDIAYDQQGSSTRTEALMLVVSSLERLFFGVRPYWGDGDSGLHITVIRSHPEHFLRRLPAVLRGRKHPGLIEAAGYHSRRAGHLSISMSGRFTLDGDIYTVTNDEQPLQLRAGTLLRFLRSR